MSLFAMSKAEREAFLAETHVAVVSVAEAGRGPLAVPVWYRYELGGSLCFVTGSRSRKAGLIRTAGRISICVQSETPPYRYVSLEGGAKIGQPDFERDIRAVAIRYLGEQMGAMYLEATAGDQTAGEPILISVQPERWFSVDYGNWMAAAANRT